MRRPLMLEEIHDKSLGIGRLELDVRTVGHAQTNRAGRSGFVKVREVRNCLKRLGGKRRALQGYLWVTGTPFSLEYPSLRGGFGWHDISWKHHFQV